MAKTIRVFAGFEFHHDGIDRGFLPRPCPQKPGQQWFYLEALSSYGKACNKVFIMRAACMGSRNRLCTKALEARRYLWNRSQFYIFSPSYASPQYMN
jgi:hypothetical protein